MPGPNSVDGNSRTEAARWRRATFSWREKEIRHARGRPAQHSRGAKGVFGRGESAPGRDGLLYSADPAAGHHRDEPVTDVLTAHELNGRGLGHLVSDGDGGRESIDLDEAESSVAIHRALS